MRMVEWIEPDEEGNAQLRQITEQEAVEHVKRAYANHPKTKQLTDEQLLEEFLVYYWAYVKEVDERTTPIG